VLQNTLSQLRLSNIASLDALMTHFTRLIELTSADEAYVVALATSLAPCILRPKTETSMTMEEKYSYRLIRDLFTHKDAIFSELKRASSLSHSGSVDARRPRAISTDESNRKAAMEARARAIVQASGGSKSRAPSPAPSPGRGHRRDRSSGGPETRFPIQTSPTINTDTMRHQPAARNSVGRQSLEVPDTPTMLPHAEPTAPPPPLKDFTNGSADAAKSMMSATYVPGMDDGPFSATAAPGDMHDMTHDLQKRNSLGGGRVSTAAARFGGRKAMPMTSTMNRASMSQDQNKRESITSEHQVGVQLTDKPMDD
jgi:hypothetical protein